MMSRPTNLPMQNISGKDTDKIGKEMNKVRNRGKAFHNIFFHTFEILNHVNALLKRKKKNFFKYH